MSRNGSGQYNLPAGNPVVTGTTITTTWANTTLNDIAASLTASIAADGQTPVTGSLAMNNNKLTGLGLGTTTGDSVEYSQFVASTTSAVAITGGTINGTSVGATTPASGKFTTLEATGTLTAAGNVSFTSTGYVLIPAGTIAQRPLVPVNGEIRYNTEYNAFEGYANGAWGNIGGGATGGGGDQVFVENGVTVTANYTLTTGKNAESVGPITISSGKTVTVPSTQRWVIL